MKYKDFDTEDFLQDEFFITWVMKPGEETNHFWKKWLEKYPEKRRVVDKASAIIRSIGYEDERVLSDDLYMEMYENIIQKEETEEVKRGKVFTWDFWKNLAAILFLAGCFYLGYEAINTKPPKKAIETEMVKRNNPAGQKSTITLPDGSTVHLNAGSALEFPDRFSDSLRLVKLTGEAFFDVIKDKDRPFVIISGDNRVKVLGTTFNVKQEKDFSVALVTGSVEVADDKGNKVFLKPKEMMVKEANGMIFKKEFDPLEVIGWKDKYLVFKNDSFQEVRRKLEAWYGVEVHNTITLPKDWSYSGVYYKETLGNVMEGISIASSFQYTIENKTVTIQ
ncbi:DUF4974 domain-containing protein [Echinicola soli]|uniref:DUF4974 domain-containing protein n=1 Tax=Echinicola soli TaxID=2591634 RepID=A0A514CJJ6_9BACT|nr:FecR family protein [Echinicola soli]QDH79824.1 DUF4974 domain-containing protein [Echinicola soli]